MRSEDSRLDVARANVSDGLIRAIVHRTSVEPDGRFSYWIELPGVQPMDHDVVGLWSEESGTYLLRLDPGVRLLRAHAFIATDVGKVFEGDFYLLSPWGRRLASWAPHKEQPFENRDGWLEVRAVDYTVPVDQIELSLEWVCRATGPRFDVLTRQPTAIVETRCHFALQIDAQELRR